MWSNMHTFLVCTMLVAITALQMTPPPYRDHKKSVDILPSGNTVQKSGATSINNAGVHHALFEASAALVELQALGASNEQQNLKNTDLQNKALFLERLEQLLKTKEQETKGLIRSERLPSVRNTETDSVRSLGAKRGIDSMQIARINHTANDDEPHIMQVLVLTVPGPARKKLLGVLLGQLNSLGFGKQTKAVNGLPFHNYKTEAEEMGQDLLPMSRAQRAEWMEVSLGFGQIHGGKTAEQTPSNGPLAIALGHHHLWQLAAAAAPEDPHAWTIILEDDARVNPEKVGLLQKILASAPPDVHIVFLEGHHCKYFEGKPGIRTGNMNIYAASAFAYAVTTVGAKLLLGERFSHAADHWLNVPVHYGKMKALCPDWTKQSPIFTHDYPHESVNSDEKGQKQVEDTNWLRPKK